MKKALIITGIVSLIAIGTGILAALAPAAMCVSVGVGC